VITDGSLFPTYATSDAANQFKAVMASGYKFNTDNTTTRLTIKSTGIINISNAPVYADNTAAIAGGLVSGDVYKTSTGQLMIVY
jgi:hypothetical protein